LLSGAVFPFMFVPVLLEFHHQVPLELSAAVWFLFLGLALSLGAVSCLVIPHNAA
jgi:hypothetical protein